MSGLDVAASIAGLVSLADMVFSRIYKYAKAAKSATEDVEKLAKGIRDLSQLLHGLRLVLLELEKDGPQHNFRLHHIVACSTTLNRIRETIDKNGYDPGPDQAHPVKANLTLFHKLKWPFSSSETKELLREIDRHINLINVALTGDTLAAVLQALSKQDETAKGVEGTAKDVKGMWAEQKAHWAAETHIRMSKKREEVLEFFGKIDPSDNHRMSLKLRQPMTGLWLTEGSIFQAWLHTRNSKLWLSGIPGAGKTIIAASAIEEAMKECSSNRAIAFFYCDYKDREKQDPVNIMGSLATQLARQSEKAFSQLEALYHICHPKDKPSCRPDLRALSLKLHEMTSCFDDVTIIVDGLDECGNSTDDVVDSLVSLVSDSNSNTRSLLLSRDEFDIRQRLEQEYEDLEIAAHSEDLKLYVAAEIEARQHKIGRGQLRIKSKNSDLKEHIMKTLVERAQGMFRWVVCQLDHLCELPTDAAKRAALKSLPKTLNATYERILERVNENDSSIQIMVQSTLQWMVHSKQNLSIDALCEAVSIKAGDKFLDEESLCDVEDILLHCSSFIRRSATENALELAHFTVQEFLDGLDPDSNSPFAPYSQKMDYVYPQLAITCLTYVNFTCFHGKIIEEYEDWELQILKYPFREAAVCQWTVFVENNWQHSEILNLALILFHRSKTQCFLSWARDYWYWDLSAKFNDLTPTISSGGVSPLHMAAALGFHELCQALIASGCDVNQLSNLGSPLHFALLGIHERLKSSYSGYKSFPERLSSLTYHKKNTENDKKVCETLLTGGADPNVPFTDWDHQRHSCAKLAVYACKDDGADHLLIKLIAAGAHFDKILMETIKEMTLRVIDQKDDKSLKRAKEFMEALVDVTNREQLESSERAELEILLKLAGSRSGAFKLTENDGLSDMSIEKLTELFLSAIRFDQVDVMRELLKDTRLDCLQKVGSRGESFLHVAAEHGSTDVLEVLLQLGVDIDRSDEMGQTSLHYAVSVEGHTPRFRGGVPPSTLTGIRFQRCVSLLLDHGASIETKDDRGWTVWHFAAYFNNESALKSLLGRVENETKDLEVRARDGFIPLYIAAREKATSACLLLLSHTFDVPESSPEGLGLVHYAVQMNSFDVLNLLPGKGLQLNQRTEDGETAFTYMRGDVDSKIVRLLLEAGIAPTSWGETPLHRLLLPRKIGDLELLRFLAKKTDVNATTLEGWTPLHYALDLDRPRQYREVSDPVRYAEILISEGADIHVRNAQGESCLQLLLSRPVNSSRPEFTDLINFVIRCITDLHILQECFNWDGVQARPLNWAIATGMEAIAELLISKGVDVDLRDNGSSVDFSALGQACWTGCSLNLFKQLTQKSLCLHEVADARGCHLVHILCESGSGAPSTLLQELLDLGIDPDIRKANKSGETPLMVAAAAGSLEQVEVLLKHGANFRARDSDNWEAIHWAAEAGCLPTFARLSALDIDWSHRIKGGLGGGSHRMKGGLGGAYIGKGTNVLHITVCCGSDDVLQYIIGRSLFEDVDCRTSDGFTSLHLAAFFGHGSLVDTLLKAGADVEAQAANDGTRPIHLAAWKGKIDVVRKLIRHGCSMAPDSSGMTPQLVALKFKWKEILELLRCHESRNEISGPSENPISDVTKLVVLGSTKSKELRNAIKLGDLEFCRSLIEDGFNPSECFHNCSGCTPFLYALGYRHHDIVRYLIEEGFPTSGNFCSDWTLRGYSAVHVACADESLINLLEIFLASDLKAGGLSFRSPVTPLHVAVANDNLPALKLLLQRLKDLNSDGLPRNADDGTHCLPNSSPLILEQQTMILPSMCDSQIHSAKLLWDWCLSDTEDLTTATIFSGTCLHVAARVGNVGAIELLLDHGASIDCLDEDNETPLHWAVAEDHYECAALLVKRGANLHIHNSNDASAAMIAAKEGHLWTLKLVLDIETDVNSRDRWGDTLLHRASVESPRVFSYLLCLGCDPYFMNHEKGGSTPVADFLCYCNDYGASISLACNWNLDFERCTGLLSSSDFRVERSKIRLLLKRLPPTIVSREIEAVHPEKESPLSVASRSGAVAILELLVRAGANLEIESRAAGTPLLIACATGRLPTVKYLVRVGANSFGSRGGNSVTAVEAAAAFPEIVRWLLVERYTDQLQISCNAEDTEREVSHWAGIVSITIELSKIPFYSPIHGCSRLKLAAQLAELRRLLRGEILNI